MSQFEPIAIVGRGCVLPGALTPDALFAAVREGRILVDIAPDGAWGLAASRLLPNTTGDSRPDPVASDRGGYVRGFEQMFEPQAYADRIEQPERLDALTQWLLYCTEAALKEARVVAPPAGTGLVIGNLSYPTVSHTRFVEDHWLGSGDRAPGRAAGPRADPRDRFSSGAPAQMVAEAFGLNGTVFALDAACASSLYALNIACQALQDRTADLMLAGGVARADPLFIHLGFTALQALSASGQSRPLHKGADGLLPAEGAGLVALKRLDDAIRDEDEIFGVIRGIGLSNDGRQSGFLAPAVDGQLRAMQAAYASAGLSPADIDYVECHATGTLRGDSTELASLAQLFADDHRPAIGSLKANIGHAITASGIASLLKVLGAFDAGVLPPTPCDDPLDAIADHGFRFETEAVPWDADGPRRAAISNFGFGGNNAHLILEEWCGQPLASARPSSPVNSARPAATAAVPEPSATPIAIAGIGVIAGASVGLPAFVDRLLGPRTDASTRSETVQLALKGLGFPPADLKESLAQQHSILAVVDEALAQVPALDPDRTGVYIGIGVDPQVARHGLRVRMPDLVSAGVNLDDWREANARAARPLTAAGVIGCMPNIPANRLHAQRDWRAPGFTVSSEELSGLHALDLAMRALRAGEIDAAVVGAADFSHEAAHSAAARALLPEDRREPGDAAVAMILMREADALAQDAPIIATVASAAPTAPLKTAAALETAAALKTTVALKKAPALETAASTAADKSKPSETAAAKADHAAPVALALAAEAGESEITARFGHAHAASGLLHLASGAISAHLSATFDRSGAWPAPRLQDNVHTRVKVQAFAGAERSFDIRTPARTLAAIGPRDVPLLRFYAASSREALIEAIEARQEGRTGSYRIAIVAADEAQAEERRGWALRGLRTAGEPTAPGVLYGAGATDGEIAFCYTGAAAAYAGVGRDLLLAFPSIGQDLCARFAASPTLAANLYGADVKDFSPATQLTGSSFLCQAHTIFTRTLLGIEPQVALGLSSGETNSLMAFGVWHDLDPMLEEIDQSRLYANELTGECRAAAAFWGLGPDERVDWRNYRIAAPLAAVEAAVAEEERVYVTVVHHYEDVVIGGDAAGCARILEKIGRTRAIDLGLDMVVHCAPLAPFADTWREIHTRDVQAVPNIRFYTNAGNRAYEPTREAAAAAITQQAVDPIDFPKTIEQAYADGVRVFIEHGPRGTVTGAIKRILGDRPHTAVALDPHEGAGLEALGRTVAQLWALGVPMQLDAFVGRLDGLRHGRSAQPLPEGASPNPSLSLAVHAPDIVWPDTSAAAATPHRDERQLMDETMEVLAPPPAGGFGYDASRHFSTPSTGAAQVAAVAHSERIAPSEPVAIVAEAQAPSSARAPAVQSLMPATVPAPPSTGIAQLFDQVATAHLEFLEQQRATHEQFLNIGLGARTHLTAVPAYGTAVGAATPAALAPSPTAPGPIASDALQPGPAAPAPVTLIPEPIIQESITPAAAAAHAATQTAAGTPAAKVAAASSTPAGAPKNAKPDAGTGPSIPVHPPIDRSTLPSTPFLDRAQMEVHAGGRISEIFGPQFERQDGFARQVRMPLPPLLFADRALTIEGEPGSMKQGRVVTETDVAADAWYLHAGRMVPGVVIESGQADLLLVSWLGADFANQGERVYRLLGCELTFSGELPKAGDTLTYDIYIDGHAKTGDVRLFFFHYDCYVGDRLLISVRNGQAGFFTEEELATSGGVIWDAADDEPDPTARMDAPPCISPKRAFSADELTRWIDGDAYGCFGAGFEMAACHTRTPNIPGGQMHMLDEIVEFDPTGGPWGRGYLRAEALVPSDAWFYDGHFLNDPCMPGTLMADAATQAMAFFMAALGFTIDRDGWRFEPIPNEVARFFCRGQVTPEQAHRLEYEVFIEEIVDGPMPEVRGALLCRSDGFKVFQCRSFGLRLVPDYPLTTLRQHLNDDPARLVGPPGSDVRGDYGALLACAWGYPSDAFGSMFARYDGPTRCPRLPSPPYHFMSSIVSADVAPGSAPSEGTVVSTFDVGPDDWYFAEGQGQMPFAVLLEALLQPCGWFACYCNFFADTEGDVAFRNLDGDDCILHRPVMPGTGRLTITTKLTRFARAGGTSIVFFDVSCSDAEGLVMTLSTAFGFFSPAMLESQRGLATTDAMRERLAAPSPVPEMLLTAGGGVFADLPGMAGDRLRMIDAVTGFWADAGEAGLGRVRARQTIRYDAWYFKAHFYGDPVQPGSLGLEALIESARALIQLKGWLDGLPNPTWEPPAVGEPLVWRYRGQVVPKRKEVISEVEALAVDIVPGESVTMKFYGTQWADGLRIYEVPTFTVRVRAG